jgi:putative nucleotidyltransferase-like protein
MNDPVHPPAAEKLALLLVCAQPHVDSDTSRRIFALAASTPDWDAILKSASEHSLAPVFCRNLEAAAKEALPPAWRRRFSEEFLRNSCCNLALTAELFRVLEALEGHGVSATPYKGPVLAAQAYGDAAMRQFSDLDIIVPQRQIVAAHIALTALGFRSAIPGLQPSASLRQIPGQYAYRKDPETMVELHTEFTLRYFPRRLDVQALCERRQSVQVAGRPVLTFSAEDTLLLLCVHGSKHFWERLGWIADIAALAGGARQLDWTLVMERARKWRIRRMVSLGAGLAARLFEVPLPDEVMDYVKRDVVARRLIDDICLRFFAAEPVQLGVFSRFAFRVRMRGSLAQGLPYAIRLTMMPTEIDRGRRGSYFDPLYALLRPLRLLRTYGWRARGGH